MKNHLKVLSLLVIVSTVLLIVVTTYFALLDREELFTIINPYMAIIAPASVALIGILIFDKRNEIFSSKKIREEKI
jgi:hypothetical protein